MTDETRAPKAGDWIVGFRNGCVGHWQISFVNQKAAVWKEPCKARVRFPLEDLEWSEQNKCWGYTPPNRRRIPQEGAR